MHLRCCIIFGWLLCRGPRTFAGSSYYLYRYWRCVREVRWYCATADAVLMLGEKLAVPASQCAVALPAVEVHITNVHRREEFRHHSYLSGVCDAVIAGAGVLGYRFAIDYLAERDA